MNCRRFTRDLIRVDGPRISGLVPSGERSLWRNGRKQTWTGHNSTHTRRLATTGKYSRFLPDRREVIHGEFVPASDSQSDS
jgi:hypothetical protein